VIDIDTIENLVDGPSCPKLLCSPAIERGAMAIAGLSVFMPLFIILQTAFSKAWALPMSATNFTFHNFREVLFDQMTVRQALFNTFQYAIITATICTFLGFAVAYISQRKLLPFSHLLASITLAPLVT